VTYIMGMELMKRGHHVSFLCYGKCDESIRFEQEDRGASPRQFFIDKSSLTEEQFAYAVNKLVAELQITHVINNLANDEVIRYINPDIPKVCVCHVQPYCVDGISRTRIWQTNTHNWRQLLYKAVSLIYPHLQELTSARYLDKGFSGAFRTADKVCFISERFYPRVLKHLPDVPLEKMHAICNPNSFEMPPRTNWNQKDKTIIYVGRVENSQKNAIGFIKMWELLSKQAPDWKAIVVGDGPDMAYDKAYAARKDIRNLQFVGNRTDVEEYYRQARFACVTSYGESWCMVVTEAMSFGCIPCVFDTYETLHDILTDGENGLIVAPSHQAMASRLLDVMTDDYANEKMSASARNSVDRFAVEKVADQWINLLTSI